MPHDPRAAANELISRGIEENQPLTHIEVQKLLYFSHGWMLGIHGQPLHHSLWEAWQHGPVLPPIYYILNYYRGAQIKEKILAHPETFTEEEQSILQSVYDQYRPHGAFGMVDITHSPGTPWHQVWNRRWGPPIITNESIQAYFARQYRLFTAQYGS